MTSLGFFSQINFDYSIILFTRHTRIPAGNYMFKVNSRNTRTRCEICSKLTIKINFEQVNAGWDIVNF